MSPKSDQSQFSPKKISMINIEKMFWEVVRWSPDGKSIDQQTINSLNQFFREMYGDQSGEFILGYWGLKD